MAVQQPFLCSIHNLLRKEFAPFNTNIVLKSLPYSAKQINIVLYVHIRYNNCTITKIYNGKGVLKVKNIYVVLSATPTAIGKAIRTVTRSTFNHASISLTKDLSEMYSFARYRARNPLVGGFIQEFPQRLTLGKNKDVHIKVFEIPLTNYQYEKIRQFVYGIKDDEDQCLYNLLAILGRPFGLGNNTYKAYVCTDFVVKALVQGEVSLVQSILAPITPGEMEQLLDKYLVYDGMLVDYNPAPACRTELVDEFFRKASPLSEACQTALHFCRLISRAIKGREC